MKSTRFNIGSFNQIDSDILKQLKNYTNIITGTLNIFFHLEKLRATENGSFRPDNDVSSKIYIRNCKIKIKK